MGIEMVLSAGNHVTDQCLSIAPKIFMAGENRTAGSGEMEFPAFVDQAYSGEFGEIAMVFLEADIRSTVVYTASFEFLYGEVDIMVSEDTHYFHDGDLAHEVFAVRGTELGKEPNLVDLKAPHIVFCYIEEDCIVGDLIFTTDKMDALCPEGFGDTNKHVVASCQEINNIVNIAIQIA